MEKFIRHIAADLFDPSEFYDHLEDTIRESIDYQLLVESLLEEIDLISILRELATESLEALER